MKKLVPDGSSVVWGKLVSINCELDCFGTTVMMMTTAIAMIMLVVDEATHRQRLGQTQLLEG